MTNCLNTRGITFLMLAVIFSFATANAQQANVNLDWRPHFNKENLTPFSAPLNSPEVKDDRTVTFRLGREELAIWGPDMKFAVGPGLNEILVQGGACGPLSANLRVE